MVLLKDSSPMIKKRVLYIGSAVPLDTVAGLEAIQKPLSERYPVGNESAIEGIDTSLSISNNEITMQYVDDSAMVIQFPIGSVTMCAAVRCVNQVNAATSENVAKFVSLNNPLAGGENSNRPAIYTVITRRTQGRRVLECHGFICSSARDAMELVKCTQNAGEHYKRNGTVRTNKSRPQSGLSDGFFASDMNQTSTMSKAVANGVTNGDTHGQTMRLIPGEPIQQIKAGPEFFEPVSKQGYFYSSNQAEVKKYSVHKLHNDEDKENVETRSEPAHHVQSPRVANGYGPTVIRIGAPPVQYIRAPPPMAYHRPPPMPHPMVYAAPPPPPQPIFVRPRFFSPPPPRIRPMPYMMPPGGPPPPVFAPPLYVRRPRSRSGSRSSSRSNSPNMPNENTTPKVPNGDADTSSDSTIGKRPNTPPTDYAKKAGGQRMSRRDQYEYRYRSESPARYPAVPPEPMPANMYDYYVYPPRHGGYEPFMMYNPHARSRSMPPRGRSKSPTKKGKGKKKQKKTKKTKQNKSKRQQDNYRYPMDTKPYPTQSDISTDSHTGYHSEIPTRTRPTAVESDGYQFYPPRDFRRNENQFMNERNFSKSIIEETRRSRDSKSYPTAYELNEQLQKSTKHEDADFSMY